MCLLLGYSANFTAIGIECEEAEVEFEPFLELNDGCHLSEGWNINIRGAAGFYLVAKLVRIVMLGVYGYWLPRFRAAHWTRATTTLLNCIFFLVCGSRTR